MWFVYDRDDGMELFESAKEAADRAECLLSQYRQMAVDNGEWFDEVESLCWGQLSAKIKPLWMVDDNGVETTDMQWEEF